MDESVSKLHGHLKEVIKYINRKKEHVRLESDNMLYLQRIPQFRDRFDKYYEEITPKIVLGSLYSCTGRLKFYKDKKLYIYLEVGEKISNGPRSAVMWPVMLTWKLEIVDQDRDEFFLLGEASCIFNRPKQGFLAHPNDWICTDLDTIVASDLIARDGAATLKWTFVATPILQIENIEDFQKMLENLEIFCDQYKGPEILLIHIHKSVEEILQRRHENLEKISRIESKISDMDSKLGKIETMQGDFQQNFEEFKQETLPVINFLKSRFNFNHIMPSGTRTEV